MRTRAKSKICEDLRNLTELYHDSNRSCNVGLPYFFPTFEMRQFLRPNRSHNPTHWLRHCANTDSFEYQCANTDRFRYHCANTDNCGTHCANTDNCELIAQILTTADITAQILTVDKNNLKISQNVRNHKTKLKILSECAQ